jgi:hypothetical protein
MTYGPPPGNPPGQPSGGYGPPQGGQPSGGYGPPAQGGYDAPGQYGPPQGGQYGPSSGGGQYSGHHGSSKSSFDLKSINPLDLAAVAAGIIALIFSFVSFYTGEASATIGGQKFSQSAHESAWHGFFGWFGVLLALVGAAAVAAAVFLPSLKLPVPMRLLALGAFALSLLCLIIALFVTPGAKSVSGVNIDYGRGYGYWIALIAVIVGAVATFLRFQQTGGQLPGRSKGGSNATPGGSGYGGVTYGAHAQQPGYQPQPGYQQPPPQGYQPPPPPQGYQQPPPSPQPGHQQPPTPPPGYQPQPPPGNYQPPAPPPGQPDRPEQGGQPPAPDQT